MITVVVAFMVITVVASAGILQVITGRALAQVHIELDSLSGFPLAVFEHEHDGNHLAIGQRFFREKTVLGLLEGKLGRRSEFPANRFERRSVLERFTFIIDEGDLHPALLRDEELGVRNDLVENTSAIRSLDGVSVLDVAGNFLTSMCVLFSFLVLVVSKCERHGEGG